MSSVSLAAIKKSYDENTHVIKGVDLEIDAGEFLVLVGPSGCGKSTLLRMVAGLEDITSGDMKIGEKRVNDVEPRDRGVAMVFQSYALYPHMTVRENMGFGLMIRKEPQSKIDSLVDDAARLLDIEEYLERLPKQLSGGQRQRVAIGRAIVRQPEVFLFDEPLSNLDASLRTQMRVELKKLHQRLKATMIYVTHDQVEAMTLADRIAVVNLGQIQQCGTPTELYEKPVNRFVAGFIGSPAMNFLNPSNEGVVLPDVGDVHEFGIRPQHLELTPQDLPDDAAKFTGTVEVVEPMGWEAHLHLDVGGQPMVAHVRTEELHDAQPGESVVFYAHPDKVHRFDSAGQAIA